MQSYLSGQPVAITISLLDEAGALPTVISVKYRILNQYGVEVLAVADAPTVAYTAGDESVSITIPDALNVITAPNTREMRIVELYVETDAGTVKKSFEYMVEAESVLVEATNSFQPYSLAVFISFEMPNLPGWTTASKQDRIAALIQAWRNIGKVPFRYLYDDDQNVVDGSVGISDITAITLSEWIALPDDFKAALRRAQVLEADYLLGGDEIGDLRRNGLMSATVGEAKQFFRTTKPLEGAICKRATKELAKWMKTIRKLTRV